MILLVRGVEDVLGCVWLAAACLTYARARNVVTEETILTEQDLVFSQKVIQEAAQQVCAKTVQNARISQWANADHPSHVRNYLRAVGAGRRLARPDECDGVRVVPWELLPFDTPVLGFGGEDQVCYRELVAWVLDIFPELVPLRETLIATSSPGPSSARRVAPIRDLEPMETLGDAGAATLMLRLGTRKFEFRNIPLVFEDHGHRDAFQYDTRRTVAEALSVRHYQSLRRQVETRYPTALTQPLGRFLFDLKGAGDSFYLRFLNGSGDLEYSTFSIRDPTVLSARGLYAFTVKGAIRYIGRCRDRYGRRVNQQYGRIHPRSCYRDGQSTNCRINALVANHREAVGFYVHPLTDDAEITTLEAALIAAYTPEWNIQGR